MGGEIHGEGPEQRKRAHFDWTSQQAFVRLSGDCNPVHVDAVFARRTLFGAAVVHGVQTLSRCLEALLSSHAEARSLRSIGAYFTDGIPVGSTIELSIRERGASFEIEGYCQGAKAITVEGEFAPRGDWHAIPLPPCAGDGDPLRPVIPDLAFDGIAEAQGTIPLYIDSSELAATYPALARCLPRDQIAQLFAMTRLVGTVCPGLHSLFSSLTLQFASDRSHSEPLLHYSVEGASRKLSRVPIRVHGAGMRGKLLTFMRPAPVVQPSISAVRECVRPGEFADVTAMVVGGSRGLGETTAKILAVGGAKVIVTYHRGRAEADELVAELTRHGGGVAAAVQLVVGHIGTDASFAIGGSDVSQIYYFASPRIRLAKGRALAMNLARDYFSCYVTDFYSLASHVSHEWRRSLKIFYPSTCFLDQERSEFPEYRIAKAAGEQMCRELTTRGQVVHFPRLPRMATDQSASLVVVSAADALEVLLREIRALQAKVGASKL